MPVHQSAFLCNWGWGALHPAPHGLRVMVSHFQLPPHPSRLLPFQKERRPGHTEARAELRGIQTAWEASLSQHRPLASLQRQDGSIRLGGPSAGGRWEGMLPLLGSLSPRLLLSRAPKRIRGVYTWERDLSPHPSQLRPRLKPKVAGRAVCWHVRCARCSTCVLSFQL